MVQKMAQTNIKWSKKQSKPKIESSLNQEKMVRNKSADRPPHISLKTSASPPHDDPSSKPRKLFVAHLLLITQPPSTCHLSYMATSTVSTIILRESKKIMLFQDFHDHPMLIFNASCGLCFKLMGCHMATFP